MSKLLKAKKILNIFHQAGYEGYIVGGFVRDLLLGRENPDVDIATNATPDVVSRLFEKTILTGVKHGTVTVIFEDLSFEVTTYRKEGEYENNRKPKTVEFISSLEEDVKRRDFTINALALSYEDEIIDYVGGRKDLENKIIRTVGSSVERFSEDALRMLRAFRFVSTLGFTIDEEALLAIEKYGHLIKNISYERILAELDKMISGKCFHLGIKALVQSSFYQHLEPFKNGIETIYRTNFLTKDMQEFLTICAVTGDIEKIRALPIPNIIKRGISLVYEMFTLEITEFSEMILFRNGLESCLMTNKLNVFLREKENKAEEIIKRYESLPIHKTCDLKFKGDDILQIFSKKPGSWIGKIIDELCLKVLLGELPNEYDVLKNYVLTKEEFE